jgi:hypothetical protein
VIDIRKTHVSVEHIWRDRGDRQQKPLRVAVAGAIIANPFAGRREADLLPFQPALRTLGEELAAMLVNALGSEAIEAYGKGAIVGEDGELEHGALWHEAGGWALRAALGGPKAIVPAAKTVAGIGSRLMIPLGHVQAAYVRSHFSTAELTVWDGPRRDEILFGLAVATGGRIDARAGGLAASEITGTDGLR